MRVRSVLGRAVRPFLLCVSLGAVAPGCGGRDSLIVGAFGDGDDGVGADGGTSSGGSAAGLGTGGKGATGGSSTGGSSATGGSNTGGDGAGGVGPGSGGSSGFGNGVGGTSGFGNVFGGSSGFGQGGVVGVAGFNPNGGNPAVGGASGFGAFPAGGASVGGASGFGQGGISAAGAPSGGFGQAGFATGGTTGAAGGSGNGGIATLGTACSTPGALACHGPAQRLMLLCEDGVWRSNETCPESQNCDRTTGVCATIHPRCEGKEPGQRVCDGFVLEECGPDLVTTSDLTECTGLCVATATSASCAPDECGDGRAQDGEECDDGNRIDTDSCTNACAYAVCGDGSISAQTETCDDGNTAPGDSCSVVCGANPLQVALGYMHTCALGASGKVQCWGYNSYGQCGSGDTRTRGYSTWDMGPALPSVNLGTSKTAVALFAGYHTSCAILNDGSLKCWGLNTYGGLGLGDTSPRGMAPNQLGDALPAVDLGSGRHAVSVSIGYAHTCALLDDHSIKCWGYNGLGQLGLGDSQARGDVPSELGDALPAVALGTGRSALAVGAGDAHTCALLDDHSVKCWGYNGYGQLGLENTADVGYLASQMGDDLPAVDLGTGRSATAIAVGDYHSCALLDDASVKCWGYNGYGQLGQGDTTTRGYSMGDMGDTLPAIELGTGHTAKALSAGTYTTCAILENDAVKCWGYNYAGGLGVGDGSTRGDGMNEMGNYLITVSLGSGRSAKAVSVGTAHTCGLLDNGTIKCWGGSSYGQLGVGTSLNLGDGAGELGDNLPYVVVTF